MNQGNMKIHNFYENSYEISIWKFITLAFYAIILIYNIINILFYKYYIENKCYNKLIK